MGNLYENIAALCAEKKITAYKLCTDLGMRNSVISDLKTGRKKGLNAETLSKIADYFGVSVDYLLGNDQKQKTPAETGERTVSDEDIMFALWGDTTDVDEDDLDDVKRYAAFVRERKKKK